jgi:prepilin-type N-terminal cleavage/methylation domain-containing protein
MKAKLPYTIHQRLFVNHVFHFKVMSMQRKSGFTLVELLVVIAIIGILTLITGPPVHRWMEERGVHEAAVQFAESMQRAKLLAIRNSANSTITVNPATRQYTITLNNPVRNEVVSLLDYRGSVVFANDPNTGAGPAGLITFTPQGLVLPGAAGGAQSVVLSTNSPEISQKWFRVSVSVAGGISIYKWNPNNNSWANVT